MKVNDDGHNLAHAQLSASPPFLLPSSSNLAYQNGKSSGKSHLNA
jgi:hypothetical protein